MQDKKVVVYWAMVLLGVISCLAAPMVSSLRVGLIGGGCIAAVALSWAVAGYQWNRKLKFPSGFRSWALLVGALAGAVVGIYQSTTDYQLLVGGLLAAHFLTSHARQKRVSLGAYAAPGIVIGVAAIPAVSRALALHATSLAEGGTTGLLRLYRIPHALDLDQLLSEHVNWDFQMSMNGLGSPVLYVALAGVLMAVMKRCWLHIVAGGVIAFYLAVAFHSGVPAMKSIAELWEWSWLAALAPVLCFVIVVLVFLSADRLLEAIFLPVAPDDNASAANPLVYYWNTALSPRVSGEKNRVSPGIVRLLVPCVAVAVISVPALASIPQQWSGKANSRQVSFDAELLASVFSEAVGADHRSGDARVAKDLGTVFDQWRFDCLEYDVRIVVSQSGDAESYDKSIWTEAPPTTEGDKEGPGLGDFVAPERLQPIADTENVKVTRLYVPDGQRDMLLLQQVGADAESPVQIKLFATMPFGTNPRLERVLLERFESVVQIVQDRFNKGANQ